jgi:1,4-dihydroxy-2-naphthoate octaprenyltransferase
MFVALVLFANDLRGIDYDKAAGVKTLAVMLGRKRALSFYKYFLLSIYFSLILLVIFGIYSAYTLIAYLTLPKAIRLVKTFYEKYLKQLIF